ncbi:disintegrin and metalloproteinase domain-containing protein 12-like, partial [Mustelus asterias]
MRSSILGLSATLAHEMGHNLGISHDTDSRDCNCADREAGCIMEEALGFKSPKTFSSCSRQDYEGSLLVGRGSCLYNRPNVDQLVGGPECGNLYVERGEECDCGKPAECSNFCCEASTCKLKPGAECSSTGACCKNCLFLPAATICRPPRGECDLPEFCTGNSSDCPVNVFLKDGHTCSNGNLYCSDGICQSADKQCQEIWGEGATSAEDLCYQVTNEEGNEFGNCGKDENDKYIKCQSQDVACGKIQCKGGGSKPIRGGNLDIVTTRLTVNGVKYVCRGTYSSFFDSSSPDLVQQGTKCGGNKACIDTKCQNVMLFNVQSCDQTCNNKGVCNSEGHCHCEEGWAAPYCAVKGIGGSIDSGPINSTDTAETTITQRSFVTEFQQSTQESPATSPETTITQRSFVTEFQQSTQESPATSPGTMVTDKNITTQFQQSTQESPDTTEWTAVIVAVVVTISILSILTAIFTYIFVKKSATRPPITGGNART